jgi:hypothetical protein
LPPNVCEGQNGLSTVAWLAGNASLVRTAKAKAKAWLDDITAPMGEYGRNGIPSKRKLADALAAYVDLYETADPADRAAILPRLQAVAAFSNEPWYHDLGKVDEATFGREAMPYLRIGMLMDRAGLDTKAYRRRVTDLKARLARLPTSLGYDEKLALRNAYRHFELPEPSGLAAEAAGVLSKRPSPYKVSDDDVSRLTREVEALFEGSDKPANGFLAPGDLTYLRWALDRLMVRYLVADDRDRVARLGLAMAYTGLTDLPGFREAIGALLQGQNPDGSWSPRPAAPRGDGASETEAVLHTTSRAVRMLALSFADRR